MKPTSWALSFSTNYIWMWGWGSWQLYRVSSFCKEGQNFSTFLVLWVCVGPSAKSGAPPNSKKRGAVMHSGVLAKSQASSTAGSWQLSHRIKGRQRTAPLHTGVSQNSSLHLIPKPSALNALSFFIISAFLSAYTSTQAAFSVWQVWVCQRLGHGAKAEDLALSWYWVCANM